MNFFVRLFSPPENKIEKKIVDTGDLFERIAKMGFSSEITEKIIRFTLPEGHEGVGKRGLDPRNIDDRKFLWFLQYMNFTDVATAYRVYHKYAKNFSWSAHDIEINKAKIQCIYNLYGTNSIQDIIDVLQLSWLQVVGSGNTAVPIHSIVEKLSLYTIVYESIGHLDKEIKEYRDIVSRNKDNVRRILDQQEIINNRKIIEYKVRRKQQLLQTHVFDGGDNFTRIFWIRWHFQRVFARFDEDDENIWHTEWKKKLGL